jgi:L-ribulose-5-phosphate 4-epimerase
MLENLKEQVFQANLELVRAGLVTLTWGNVSGFDRTKKIMVIKSSGVDYDAMKVTDMVVVDLNGTIIEGTLRPSSDTPTHLRLYKAFPAIGGITHTHSTYATMFAQACREIPCLGTTHADHFNGPVPVTRFLTKDEVNADYEGNTGDMSGVLVAGHAPFMWGNNAADSVRNAIAMEQVALMAIGTLQINPDIDKLPDYILSKHYQRKHGPDSYYGQKKS